MPYFQVDGRNIFDRLQRPKFHFLVFARQPNGFHELKDELASQYPELLDFSAFANSPEVGEVFGTNKDFSVVLRPDNHVGTISSDNSSSHVEEYLIKLIGSQCQQ